MNIIIIGGKTAGHISPAIELMKEYQEANFYYAGSKKTMEYDLVKDYCQEFIEYDLCGIKRNNPFLIFKTIFYFIKCYFKAKKDIKRIKPTYIIGMGGNISAPIILAGKKEKIKCFVHEQNVVLGMTNKFLSKYVDKVFLTFDNLNLKNGVVTGNPTANKVKKYQKTNIVYPKNYYRVLFIGGSLGAEKINELAIKIIENAYDLNVYFVLIAGKNYHLKDVYKNAKIINYTNELHNIMQEVDLIISRAGASTIAEVLSIPKPLILIPSPNVTNNHQEKNAHYLEDKNLAIMIKEENITAPFLLNEIMKILFDKNRLNDIIRNNQKNNKGDALCLMIENLKN